VLLVQRGHAPHQGAWAFPGGFVAIDQALEDAALRELEGETGLKDIHLEQLYTFGDPHRDPRGRVISVPYLALVPGPPPEPRAGDSAAQARWCPAYDHPTLAFDHEAVLACAVRRLRRKLRHTAVGFQLVRPEFTMRELRLAYESVLGKRLDKRSFRRRIARSGVIEGTGEVRMREGRPARLHRLRADTVGAVKSRRLFP
jgi:8-oxo-dGTP diphosphatase